MPEQWNPLRLTADRRTEHLFAIVALAAYAALTLWVGLHHEPWRDEADAWLLVRDAPIDFILSWTHNAGTPALWYVALKPLVRLDLPYSSMTILNLAISWAAAAVVLLFAPFTRLTKLLILGSYFFGYEYSIIARSYSLTILLLFVALAAMDKRPLLFAVAIAALFNTNVHGAVMAAVLGLMALRRAEARRYTLVMAGGALIAFLQLYPSGAIGTVRHLRLYAIPIAIGDAFLPGAPIMISVVAGAAVLIAIAVATRSAFLLITVAALLALYTFVWFGGLRHSGLILLVTLAAVWLARDVRSPAAALLLNLTLLGSAAYTLVNASYDVRFAFSGSKEMAQFIDHRFDGYAIAAHNAFATEALLPYLPGRQFWYAGEGRFGTYLNWNGPQAEGAQIPYDAAVRSARKRFGREKWLLLVNSPMPDPEKRGFRLLHATSVTVFRHLDERYWLYAPQ